MRPSPLTSRPSAPSPDAMPVDSPPVAVVEPQASGHPLPARSTSPMAISGPSSPRAPAPRVEPPITRLRLDAAVLVAQAVVEPADRLALMGVSHDMARIGYLAYRQDVFKMDARTSAAERARRDDADANLPAVRQEFARQAATMAREAAALAHWRRHLNAVEMNTQRVRDAVNDLGNVPGRLRPDALHDLMDALLMHGPTSSVPYAWPAIQAVMGPLADADRKLLQLAYANRITVADLKQLDAWCRASAAPGERLVDVLATQPVTHAAQRASNQVARLVGPDDRQPLALLMQLAQGRIRQASDSLGQLVRSLDDLLSRSAIERKIAAFRLTSGQRTHAKGHDVYPTVEAAVRRLKPPVRLSTMADQAVPLLALKSLDAWLGRPGNAPPGTATSLAELLAGSSQAAWDAAHRFHRAQGASRPDLDAHALATALDAWRQDVDKRVQESASGPVALAETRAHAARSIVERRVHDAPTEPELLLLLMLTAAADTPEGIHPQVYVPHVPMPLLTGVMEGPSGWHDLLHDLRNPAAFGLLGLEGSTAAQAAHFDALAPRALSRLREQMLEPLIEGNTVFCEPGGRALFDAICPAWCRLLRRPDVGRQNFTALAAGPFLACADTLQPARPIDLATATKTADMFLAGLSMVFYQATTWDLAIRPRAPADWPQRAAAARTATDLEDVLPFMRTSLPKLSLDDARRVAGHLADTASRIVHGPALEGIVLELSPAFERFPDADLPQPVARLLRRDSTRRTLEDRRALEILEAPRAPGDQPRWNLGVPPTEFADFQRWLRINRSMSIMDLATRPAGERTAAVNGFLPSLHGRRPAVDFDLALRSAVADLAPIAWQRQADDAASPAQIVAVAHALRAHGSGISPARRGMIIDSLAAAAIRTMPASALAPQRGVLAPLAELATGPLERGPQLRKALMLDLMSQPGNRGRLAELLTRHIGADAATRAEVERGLAPGPLRTLDSFRRSHTTAIARQVPWVGAIDGKARWHELNARLQDALPFRRLPDELVDTVGWRAVVGPAAAQMDVSDFPPLARMSPRQRGRFVCDQLQAFHHGMRMPMDAVLKHDPALNGAELQAWATAASSREQALRVMPSLAATLGTDLSREQGIEVCERLAIVALRSFTAAEQAAAGRQMRSLFAHVETMPDSVRRLAALGGPED